MEEPTTGAGPLAESLTRLLPLKRPKALFVTVACALIAAGWIFLTTGSKAVTRANDPGLLVVRNAPPTASETISVGASTSAPAVAKGFVGLSIEYQSVAADAGSASHPDPVFDQLLANLNPGQRPVVRIGGDSTDHTWVPVAGVENAGLTYALTPAWLASVRKFAGDTDAQLIFGINLEVDQPTIAQTEARALLSAVGADHILQWEVGNEPNLYGTWAWYLRIHGDLRSGVFTRSRDYGFDQYLQEFNAEASSLPDIQLAGPALGSPGWMSNLGEMLTVDRDLGDVTYHAYPLNCFASPGTSAYPSIQNLLSATASDGLADEVAAYATQARAAGRAFRVDELNSSACGGNTGVSDTFASALWVTDALFAMASKGVTGVNVQDFNSSRYKPFAFEQVDGRWVAEVEPMYYGMLLFSRAAPAGSKLLAVTTSGGASVRAWAAQTPVGSAARGARTVTLINDDTTHAETVKVKVPGTGRGTLLRMLASGGAAAKTGISIAGLDYPDATTRGQLQGTPRSAEVSPGADGAYQVSLPPASAVLLTLSR